MTTHPAHRGSILVEDAELIHQETWPDEQFVVRLKSPRIAAAAQPGSFVHLTCSDEIPMRRPLSLMRVDGAAGWIDILYKVHGDGLRALAKQPPGQVLSAMGPIGQPFKPTAARNNLVLIGGGVGIPPMVFLAEALAGEPEYVCRAFFGSELPFPFATARATAEMPGIDADTHKAMTLLNELGVASRLASQAGFDHVYAGFVTELARQYLATLSATALDETEIFACGPTPMLRATAALARDFKLPCQVSLEEYMACAVGGCAGCTVPVRTDAGVQMKRVCVDGPVFSAASVFPAET